MDKRQNGAVGSIAFDGASNEVLESLRNIYLPASRSPPNRLMGNVFRYANDSYPLNEEVCFNSARFAKVQDQIANDGNGNYCGESGDDVIENEQYLCEQEGISGRNDQQNYYPLTRERSSTQNNVSFKTTRKSGSNQSKNEDYYRIVDNEISNTDTLKEADNLYATISNDAVKGSGYYFLQRNAQNPENGELPSNEPVCFGKTTYYQDFENEKYQPGEKYSYNKTGNYAFAGPEDQFSSKYYPGPGMRPANTPKTFDQQRSNPFSKSSNFQTNEPLESRRKESIYREVLNTINETVTELKNAGLEDENQMQDSFANLDQIQRYRNYMQDKFGGIQLKGSPMNEPFMARRASPQRHFERKPISKLDKRNDCRRVINEQKLNTISEPKISPNVYRRFEENRSPIRQNASNSEMMQKFQSPENKANKMYRRYCYYNMNDQYDKKFLENIDGQ